MLYNWDKNTMSCPGLEPMRFFTFVSSALLFFVIISISLAAPSVIASGHPNMPEFGENMCNLEYCHKRAKGPVTTSDYHRS